MKNILLKLSDENHHRLKWLADKLGLSLNATLRALIPNIRLPETKIINEKDIFKAASSDLVEVVLPIDRDHLDHQLDRLKEKGWAKTLANEIKRQLIDKEANYLTVGTYKRLSRWVHPHRQTEREKYVQPIAETISKLLFEHIIKRIGT